MYYHAKDLQENLFKLKVIFQKQEKKHPPFRWLIAIYKTLR